MFVAHSGYKQQYTCDAQDNGDGNQSLIAVKETIEPAVCNTKIQKPAARERAQRGAGKASYTTVYSNVS